MAEQATGATPANEKTQATSQSAQTSTAESSTTPQAGANAQGKSAENAQTAQKPQAQAQATQPSAPAKTALSLSTQSLALTQGGSAELAVSTDAPDFTYKLDKENIITITREGSKLKIAGTNAGVVKIEVLATKEGASEAQTFALIDVYAQVQSAIPNYEQTYAQLLAALKDNANWIEQIRLSFVSNSELYRAFHELELRYREGLSKLLHKDDKAQYILDETLRSFENIKNLIDSTKASLALSEKKLDELEARVLENTTTSTQVLTDITTKKTELENQITEIKALLTTIEQTYTALQKLSTGSEEFLSAIRSALSLRDELITLKGSVKTEATKYLTDSIESLKTEENSILLNLNSFYEGGKEELENIKTEVSNQANFINTSKQEITTAIEGAKTDFATLAQEKKSELEESKNTISTALENARQEAINSITNLQNANNLKSLTYSQSGTFTPVQGFDYYYVFLRGGNGSADAVGQESSFGELIKCAGGVRGEGASAGEDKGLFLKLSAPVDFIVGAGGICIVSYADSAKISPLSVTLNKNTFTTFIGSSPIALEFTPSITDYTITNTSLNTEDIITFDSSALSITPKAQGNVNLGFDLELNNAAKHFDIVVAVEEAISLNPSELNGVETLENVKVGFNREISDFVISNEVIANAELASFDKDAMLLTPLKAGSTTLDFDLTYKDGQIHLQAPINIEALPDTQLSIAPSEVVVAVGGQSEALNIATNAPSFTCEVDSAFATFDMGSKTFTGVKAGQISATFKAKAENAKEVSNVINITIN